MLGGFFLACEDYGGRFDKSFSSFTFFFFKVEISSMCDINTQYTTKVVTAETGIRMKHEKRKKNFNRVDCQRSEKKKIQNLREIKRTHFNWTKLIGRNGTGL